MDEAILSRLTRTKLEQHRGDISDRDGNLSKTPALVRTNRRTSAHLDHR